MSELTYSLYQKGLKLLKLNRPEQAILFLEEAKSLEPGKGSIREALARSYYNCGRFDLAREHFEKAIEIDPTNDYAHFGLGLCLVKQGDIARAAGHIKIALAMKPDNTTYQRALDKIQY